VTFLAPLLGLGALGVAAAVWLHLRRRRPALLLPFSALRFLDDRPPPRAGALRLRHPLLFALRAGGLLLVAAAFARPALLGAPPPPVTESTVHLLDATLSRRADPAGFARDRTAIARALGSGGPGVQQAVVVLGSGPEVLAAFSAGAAEAAGRVAEVRPGWAGGSYLEGFRLAASLLESALGERRRIVFYSDQQAGQWAEGESSPPFLRAVEVELSTPPADPEPRNAALSLPRVQRVLLGEEALVELTADLYHQGGAGAARVRVEANGAEILAESFDLAGKPPVLVFRARWAAPVAAWVEGRVVVETDGDVLPGDDAAHFALAPVREGSGLLVARSPYLAASLAPEVMRGRWAFRTLTPAGAAAATPLADVLVVEAGSAQSQAVRDLVWRHLDGGRGVVVFVDRWTPLVRGFLAELGCTAEGGDGWVEDERGFRYVALFHPLFAPFRGGELGSLLEPRIHAHAALSCRGARALLYGDEGAPLLFEGTSTPGRLLLVPFGMDRAGTDWPLKPSFLPFLDLALQHVRGVTEPESAFAPGELVTLPRPDGRSVSGVVVRRGAEVVARAAVAGEDDALRLAAPAEPGVYRLAFDDDAEPAAVAAVNPPAAESRLSWLAEPPALAAWTMTGSAPAPPPDDGTAPALPGEGRELWWPVLLAGAALLASEQGALALRRSVA
jgi:hypothetical protein